MTSYLRALAISLVIASTPAVYATTPIVGIAQGVAFFEACAKISPALAQRNKLWLERLSATPDMLNQVRAMDGYASMVRHFELEFSKQPREVLVQECNAEHDKEAWIAQNGTTSSSDAARSPAIQPAKPTNQ